MARDMAEASKLRSRIAEILKICNDGELDDHTLLKDCALHVQSTVQPWQQIVSDFSDLAFLGIQDSGDAYLDHLRQTFNNLEDETTHLSNEIELLAKSHKDDCFLLEAKLKEMESSLDYMSPKDQNTEKATQGIDSPMLADDTIVNLDTGLEQLELDNKINDMKSILKSLQDLQCKVKWFDVVDEIEDAMAGLKVLALDVNCIRLSLKTCMPTLEGVSILERVEDIVDVDELNHELLVEVFEGTMKLKNVQVFPNDVYVNDIVDAAKSVSKSSLQWFIQKVQDRIILSTLRRLVVRDANKSRYSLEYLDKDETIVAHMASGIDAYIKLSHGWPLYSSPLKLISIKGSDNFKTTPSVLCEIEKLANSLDSRVRQNISRFVDAVEKVLTEQLQFNILAGGSSG